MRDKKLAREEQERLNEELLNAVWKNNLSAVKAAIDAGADVNAKDEWNLYALQNSILKDTVIMEYLLENGANPNVQDRYHRFTPLHEAAYKGYLDKIQLLLKHGADMYIKDNEGRTPYVINLIYKKDNIAEFLLSQGYIPSENDIQILKNNKLQTAISSDKLLVVKDAVEDGADVNAEDERGNSMLQTASDKKVTVVKYLLKAGADPNRQNYNGQTALHKAVSYGHMNKVKLLLKYKAGMYIKDKWGKTPFDLSLLCGYYNIAELFISAGYIPSEEGIQQIKNHRLFKAVKEGNLPAIKTAVEDGADVNAKTKDDSRTPNDNSIPMLLSVSFKDIKITKYLLDNGANINVRDCNGWTRLHYAVYYGHLDEVKLLLKYNANMHMKCKLEETPFAIAARWKRYDMAELFIINGYVPSNEDFDGQDGRYKYKSEERAAAQNHLISLAAQVQEHNAKLKKETEAVEFAYADEIIEM